MAFIGSNPKSKTQTLTPQSTTPTNVTDGMLFISDGTSREEGLWRYDSSASAWVKVGSGLNTDVVYIDDNFESGVASWSTYADAAGTAPVDGTGGSPNITFTSNTSSPLRGSADGLITKDAADRQGQGISRAFTINNTDQAKVLTVQFNYKTSTNFVDDDIAVFVYDVTNATLIRVVPQDIKATSLTNTFLGSFQTASNSTSYRLIIHVASTNASAYTVNIDNVSIVPLNVTSNSLISATAYINANQSIPNNSATAVVWNAIKHDSTASFNLTTGVYTLPESGVYLITSKIAFAGNATGNRRIQLTIAGNNTAWSENGGLTSNNDSCQLTYLHDGTKGEAVVIQALQDSGGALDILTASSSYQRSFISVLKVPSPTASEFASGSQVAAIYTQNSGQAIPNATSTTILFNTKVKDTTNSFNTATGIFTVPETGDYAVSVRTFYDTSTAWEVGEISQLSIVVDGVDVLIDRYTSEEATGAAKSPDNELTTCIPLNKGQELKFQLFQSSDSSINLTNSGIYNRVSIVKVPTSGASSSAGETVAAIYTSNSGQTIEAAGSGEIINFEDIESDTHAAVTIGASWKFTAPISAYYNISAQATFASGAWTAGNFYYGTIRKNGTAKRTTYNTIQATFTEQLTVSVAPTTIYLSKDDYIDFFVDHNRTGGDLALIANGEYTYISIHKI